MSPDPTSDQRLAQIEARLAQLESHQAEAESREQRQRQRAFVTRVVLVIAVGVAYLLYLRYALSIA